MHEPTAATEVHVVNPFVAPEQHAGRPHVVWAAPGSMHLDAVADAWTRRGRLTELARVTGPWGVVLWDPAAQTYLAVTDPVGVQPLSWSRTSTGTIAVASWLATLVDRDDVDDAPDPEGALLQELPTLRSERILHRTRFRHVFTVPWGRAVRFLPDGSVRTEQYWDPRALPGPDESLSLDDCAELIRERLDRAIARSLTGSGPYGSHVSGGLDCSSIAVLADRALHARGEALVAGYSWSPSLRDVPMQPDDERRLLTAIAEQERFQVKLRSVPPPSIPFEATDHDRYPRVTLGREQHVLTEASSDGVRILLSGWGGDELISFNGRGVLRALARQRRYRTLWRHLDARLGRDVPANRRHVAVGFAEAAAPWALERARWLLQPNHRRRRSRAQRLDTQIDAMLREASPLAAEVRRERRDRFDQPDHHRAVQLELLTGGHLQRRTSAWYQAGRYHGIEYRYPLLDLDVVETALALPWWAYRSEGWTRLAFRRAVEPSLPESLVHNDDKTEPSSGGVTASPSEFDRSDDGDASIAHEIMSVWSSVHRT